MHEDLKYFKLAKELNEKWKNKFLIKKNEVHVRGNIKSLSLISLSSEKPEIGFSGLRTDITFDDKLKKLKNREVGRSTPEKKLQSFIIRNAIINKYQLIFDNNIKFITSEIAVYNENNKRIVNDILGFSDGCIYVIELKSDRAMGRLIEQVNNFENIINEKKDFFYELMELYDYIWDRKSIKKIIIWPEIENSRKSSKELSDKNIIEYLYTEEYEFIKYEK